jgi:hypothetical protein
MDRAGWLLATTIVRKELLLARDRELGRKYGAEYAAALKHIMPGISHAVHHYGRKHAGAIEVTIAHLQHTGVRANPRC